MAVEETKKAVAKNKPRRRKRPPRQPNKKDLTKEPKTPQKKAVTPKAKPKTEVKAHVDDIKVCERCHEHIDKKVIECPKCTKKQTDNSIIVIICILGALLLISLAFSHFYNDNPQEEGCEIEPTVELITYEELTSSHRFLNTNVQIIGTVLDINFDEMLMTLDSNVFGTIEQYIVMASFVRECQPSFTIGDMIIIYGYFHSMEDDIPYIEAIQIIETDFNNERED